LMLIGTPVKMYGNSLRVEISHPTDPPRRWTRVPIAKP